MTTLINIKHNKNYDIYIGRPSKWGNPFSHKIGTRAKFLVSSVDEAVEKYEEYARNNPEIMNFLDELDGKILGCWCTPQKCHGDILIKLINEKNNTLKKFQ